MLWVALRAVLWFAVAHATTIADTQQGPALQTTVSLGSSAVASGVSGASPCEQDVVSKATHSGALAASRVARQACARASFVLQRPSASTTGARASDPFASIDISLPFCLAPRPPPASVLL